MEIRIFRFVPIVLPSHLPSLDATMMLHPQKQLIPLELLWKREGGVVYSHGLNWPNQTTFSSTSLNSNKRHNIFLPSAPVGSAKAKLQLIPGSGSTGILRDWPSLTTVCEKTGSWPNSQPVTHQICLSLQLAPLTLQLIRSAEEEKPQLQH